MAKVVSMIVNAIDEERESILDQVVNTIAEKGNEFGDTIIEMMLLNDVNRVKMGIVAVGLAKAVATMKVMSAETGIDIDKLYKAELIYYQKKFKKYKVNNSL